MAIRIKDKIPKVMKSNVIYRIDCSCGKYYIGETSRNLQLRLDEHKRTDKPDKQLTEVGRNLKENPGHVANFGDPKILGQCKVKF